MKDPISSFRLTDEDKRMLHLIGLNKGIDNKTEVIRTLLKEAYMKLPLKSKTPNISSY